MAVTPPSNMEIDDMPEDCLLLILEELAFQTSLAEIFQKAFVSQKWFTSVQRLMVGLNGSSLKLFDSALNLEPYAALIAETELQTFDERFALVDRTTENNPEVTWKQMDHLILNTITGTSLANITYGLKSFFSETITHLVVNTFNRLDFAQILTALPHVTSLTLVELPESRVGQRPILEALVNMTSLRQLHIFYMDNSLPLDAQVLEPVLARLEAFTLHSYPGDNRSELLKALNPAICRRISLGPFGSYQRGRAFEKTFGEQFPELLPYLALFDKPRRRESRIVQEHARRRGIIAQMVIEHFAAHPEARPEWTFLNHYNNEDEQEQPLFIPPALAAVNGPLVMLLNGQANELRHRLFVVEFLHQMDEIIRERPQLAPTVPNPQAQQYREVFDEVLGTFLSGTWLPVIDLLHFALLANAFEGDSDDEEDD